MNAAAATPPCVAVAHSGGRDSTALLHATLQQAQALGLRVAALHVHHGLQSEADDWLAHVRRQAGRWSRQGLPLTLLWRRLAGRPQRGDSVEAWARRERYAALAAMAREAGASLVLLAHHRRDQAETFLLQALRGAGPAGLAAMPRSATRNGITWARPWLQQPREAVEAYVRRHRLAFVDDPSNAGALYARSRLRGHAWPALANDFEGAEAALALAAQRAAEAAEALDELAALDLAAVADAQGLDLARWAALSPARRANALRAWLQRQRGRGAEEALLQRLCAEAAAGSAPARWPVAGGGELRRYRGRLRWAGAATAEAVSDSAADHEALPATSGRVPLARWRGTLVIEPVASGGLPLAALSGGEVELRARAGAERFQRGGGVPRGLKKQYQQAGVPAWQRGGPLLYCGGRLAFVPALGIDGRLLAAPGEPQVALRWEPDAGPAAG